MKRFAPLLIFSGLLILAFAMRIQSAEFFRADFLGHYNFFDTDSYYHLRRLVFFFQNGFVQTFDPLILWPEGSRVPWGEAYIWFLGLPLMIFGVESFESLEMGAALVQLITGILICVGAYAYVKRTQTFAWQAPLAFLICALSPLLIRHSSLGSLDHHSLELLVSFVLLASVTLSWERPPLGAALMGIFQFVAVWISSATLFPLAAYGVCLLFRKMPPRSLLIMALSSLLPLLFYSLWKETGFQKALPSFFHLCLFSVAFLAIGIQSHFKKRAKALAYAILALLGAGVWGVSEAFRHTLISSFRYVFGQSGSLASIDEAQPVWLYFGEGDASFLIANLSVLALLICGGRAWIRAHLRTHWSLLVFVLLLALPGLLQKRFTHLWILPLLIFLSSWVGTFWASLSSRVAKVSYASAVAFVLILPFVLFGVGPQMTEQHKVQWATLQALKTSGLAPESSWAVLGGKSPPPFGVWADPNLGHHLLYLFGRPVVGNAFFSNRSFARDLSFRLKESPEELAQAWEEAKLEWVVIQDDFQYFRFLHQVLRRDFDRFERPSKGQDLILRGEEMDRLAWIQILKTRQSPPGWAIQGGFQLNLPYAYREVLILSRL